MADLFFQGTVSHACCCLCGAAIQHTDESPEWTSRFHTVYATDMDAGARAYLSTYGRREDMVDLIDADPSDIASHGKKTLHINLLPYDFHDPSLAPFVSDVSPEAWGYPFHSACWKILTAFRPIAQEDLQSLLNLGRSMPKQNGMLNWGHDYGGRAKHSHAVAPGEEDVLTAPVGVTGFDDDPGDIDELHHIFENHRIVPSQTREGPTLEPRTVATSDPFARLPDDILFSVLDYLTLADVSLLKQTSRTFANLELPGRFWRNFFRMGQVFDYIIEAREYSQVHWKYVCKAIKVAMDNGTVHHYAIWLRKCSWDMCYPLQQALEAMRDMSDCLGDAVKSHFEPYAPQDQGHWVTASRALKQPGVILDHGCRTIYERVMALPAKIRDVHVSTVELFGRQYISGLKAVSEDEDTRSIGFQSPVSGKFAVGMQHILGFNLAFDGRGVRGLCLVYDNEKESEWIGDHDNIPKRKLRSGLAGDAVTHLKCAFDAAKLVALSVNDTTPISSDHQNATEFGMSALWYPDLPDPDLIFPDIHALEPEVNGNDEEPSQDLPKVFRLFAEEGPESLTNITVRHRIHETEVLKIESLIMRSISERTPTELGFRRTDNRYNSHETMNCDHEESFEIDGPGGERIVKVGTWWLGESMVGLTVETNYTRKHTFIGWIDEYKYGDQLHYYDFEAGDLTVVGFWATMNTEMGFKYLGPVLR